MNILLLTWKSFGNEDMIAAFRDLGHTVKEHPIHDQKEVPEAQLRQELSGAFGCFDPDFVFSFNYFPIVSALCKKEGIPYISWIYDSPYVRLYHYTVNNPTNYVFVFDSAQYAEFHNAGIQTVHYLPMAANVERLSAMQDENTFEKTRWRNRHPVAFVGSLYTEKHQFYERMKTISPYTRGYLEGLMAAQRSVYGYNFIQELLPRHIIEDMQKDLPMRPGADSVESIEYLFAQYVINRKLTSLERTELLSQTASRFGLDLYTPDSSVRFRGCTNHGPVDYYDFAPYVFRHAKINLNISLRSILSGIPLRAFDIMGAGGFLMSNYQEDFLKHFVPDEDFVFYESAKDLTDKIEYYLKHDAERSAIAQNGLRRISEHHTYKHRVREMISYLP